MKPTPKVVYNRYMATAISIKAAQALLRLVKERMILSTSVDMRVRAAPSSSAVMLRSIVF
jgi:hypothetical protein